MFNYFCENRNSDSDGKLSADIAMNNGNGEEKEKWGSDILKEMKDLRGQISELSLRLSGLEESVSRHTLPSQGTSLGTSDNRTYQSSAVFTPSAPVTPFSSPGRNTFQFDSRSSGYASKESSPQSIPDEADFFTQSSLYTGLPESQEGRMQDMFRSTDANYLLNSLAKHMQRFAVSDGRGGLQNIHAPSANNGGNLRRSNSNRNKRSRRFSLPDASRFNNWPSSTCSGRNASFIGISSEAYGDAGADDAFSGDASPRANIAGMKELEIFCRFGEIGAGPGQMNAPHGFCLGFNQEIIVADTNNHRIQFFDKHGNYQSMWGKFGKRDGQLWFPRKVAWMPEKQRVVVCDRGQERSRIQIFSRIGVYERTIAMDYVAIVAGMTVWKDYLIVIDSVNPTCLILDHQGNVFYWFSCVEHMKEPSDVVVANNCFYICDFKGHNVCVYNGRGEFVKQIGDNKVINFPNGIDVTVEGHVLVGDSHGNRFHVAAYGADGRFLAEYECPHMKVSRCCGLVLTPEGRIVTIAKNNNFILMLERLELNGYSPPFHSMLKGEEENIQETHF